MGLNKSKPQNTRGTPTNSPGTGPLYPNLANEFPAYGHPNTVHLLGTPAPTTYESYLGNSMPHYNGPSYPYNPAVVPSAPPEVLCADIPAIGHSKVEQEVQVKPAEPSGNQHNRKNEHKPCLNAAIGCKLHFDDELMQKHLKECLFRDISCPLNGISGKCSWRDKVKNITTHFEDNHPENIGQVNTERSLTNPRTIHLVELKPFKFLVHIKVDEAEKKTLVAVQHYSTEVCASKWDYEFEFKGPHMEKILKGTCITAGVSVEEKFKQLQCRVLSMSICVMDGFKRGGLTYKYRIMKKENFGERKKVRNMNKETNRVVNDGSVPKNLEAKRVMNCAALSKQSIRVVNDIGLAKNLEVMPLDRSQPTSVKRNFNPREKRVPLHKASAGSRIFSRQGKN